MSKVPWIVLPDPSGVSGSMASGGGGVPLAGSTSALHLPDGFVQMRRRSILGPPSLFPSQRQRQPSGGGAAAAQVQAAAPNKADDEDSRKTSAAEMRNDADEVAVTIADLDFYYGLGATGGFLLSMFYLS